MEYKWVNWDDEPQDTVTTALPKKPTLRVNTPTLATAALDWTPSLVSVTAAAVGKRPEAFVIPRDLCGGCPGKGGECTSCMSSQLSLEPTEGVGVALSPRTGAVDMKAFVDVESALYAEVKPELEPVKPDGLAAPASPCGCRGGK